jgi:uncharacterized membrane protein YheB (UPF0754 family)
MLGNSKDNEILIVYHKLNFDGGLMNKSLGTNIIAIGVILIGVYSPYYSNEILTMGLYSFSGAITNWLAIHMLFEKVPGLYGSGIITNKFEDFKLGIKELIMKQFFTQENFERFMSDNSSSLVNIEKDSIMGAIDFDNVFKKLKQAIIESPFGGMLGMFGGEAALDPLKPQFEDKFNEIISDLLADEKFIASLSQKATAGGTGILDNITEMVDGRLNELTPEMVKDIIQNMIREHLGWLVVWGGVFGALIGLATTLI